MDGQRTSYRRAVRAAPAPVSFNALDLLYLALLGRGYEARFVATADARYLLTNADDELVQNLAARMGAVLGQPTRLGLSRGYAT